jgi:prephenate dehydratase
VLSIPVATAQCSAWLRDTLPNAEVHAANSTADAARSVGERSAAGEKGLAALAPANAAELYGLTVVARDIADHPGNQTRFVLVSQNGIPQPTGHDKTGIVVFQRADEPGSLISILQEFAARRINLSLLSSRPTKAGGLGDLHTKQGGVKFLGSYPAAGDQAHTAREHADARWQDADDWVLHLRTQIRD